MNTLTLQALQLQPLQLQPLQLQPQTAVQNPLHWNLAGRAVVWEPCSAAEHHHGTIAQIQETRMEILLGTRIVAITLGDDACQNQTNGGRDSVCVMFLLTTRTSSLL